ncbi:MAG: methylenetetrahydromethanopterin dehydrogenase [Candidatus Pacebacteria bacterium]|nr:methylenetetrahydromethanopterin dehydrogenase [Candidatus Paceibacterota bacterium]
MSDRIAAILHYITPLNNPSAFDVNMAIDAGFHISSYTGVALSEIRGHTQDAMFSRPPDSAKRTCIFIGGREVSLAMEMLIAAREARLEPFIVSVFADPNGAFTTAAALVAVAESQLLAQKLKLAGSKIAIFGGKGGVGFIAGLIAAKEGAEVSLIAHNRVAKDTISDRLEFFRQLAPESYRSAHLEIVIGDSDSQKGRILDEQDAIFTTGPAGVELISAQLLLQSTRLKLALDVNAVPPLGLGGVGVLDNGLKLTADRAVRGVGALTIGNVKYRCQQQILQNLAQCEAAEDYDFHQAFAIARAIVAADAASHNAEANSPHLSETYL